MNHYKNYLHIWITVTSFAGFLGGWAALAQAGRLAIISSTNPASVLVSAGAVALPTASQMLPVLNSASNNVQTFTINPATPTPMPQPTPLPQVIVQPQPLWFSAQPVIRTGGSG